MPATQHGQELEDSGVEVGYAEKATNSAVGAVTGVSIVVPPTSRPVLVIFGGYLTSTVATDTVYLGLYVNGVESVIAFGYVVIASGYVLCQDSLRLPASAVSRTLTLASVRFAGTGVVSVPATATYPVKMHAVTL